MKLQNLLFALLTVCISLCGCVPSLNPLSQKNEVQIPELTSTQWKSSEGVFTITRKDGVYAIQRKNEKEQSFSYSMTLCKLGNSIYASVEQNYEKIEKYDGLDPFFLQPVYQIYRLVLEKQKNGSFSLNLFPICIDDSFQTEGLVRPSKSNPVFVADSAAMRNTVEKFSAQFFSEKEKISFVPVHAQ